MNVSEYSFESYAAVETPTRQFPWSTSKRDRDSERASTFSTSFFEDINNGSNSYLTGNPSTPIFGHVGSSDGSSLGGLVGTPTPSTAINDGDSGNRKFDFLASAEDSEDIFGLGDFGQVFVTEEDLDKAREKLPEDEIVSAEDSIRKVLAVLDQWKILNASIVMKGSSSTTAFRHCSLYSNYIEVGKGDLIVGEKTVSWTGGLLAVPDAIVGTPTSLEANSTSIPIETPDQTLRWRADQLTDVRSKDVQDARPIVTFTVDEEYFLQLVFPEGDLSCATNCVDAIRTQQRSQRQPDSSAAVRLDGNGEKL
ncbi:hypothetical protein HKX48_005974 [Thoreauomyces humboldtii]|nr:hypothetical protein HKX48_005974 [Thoreauomyces humboldtii]